MEIKRVLITGATGFIGSRLLEVMSLTRAFEPRAFIHSPARAARITRFPIDFLTGDLRDRDSVDAAMRGSDAVVHLARGHDQVMTKGLENLLWAAVKHRVSRFIHLSSIAVYGDNPGPETVSEAAPTKCTNNAYGNQKLRQEYQVLLYGSRYGLPIVILRPPNVYGPFSQFTLRVINSLRSKSLAIVDGGENPCNIVYVDNLIQAILLALWRKEALNEIFFVTEPEVISWEQFINDHAKLLGMTPLRVSAEDLRVKPAASMMRNSLRVLPRVLLSGELRDVLREVPVVAAIEQVLYNRFQSLSPETQQKLRLWINGPQRFLREGPFQDRFDADNPLIAVQARTVAHSCQKAQRLLGYTAPIAYQQGMNLTEAWLRYSQIIY